MQDSKKTEKTNSNLKYWLEIPGFIIVLLVSLKVLSYAMDPIRLNMPGAVADKDMYVASALTEKENSIDVIMAGDSEAMIFMSSKILWDEAGINSYGCSQPAQRICETYLFLEDILEKQKPEVVVFETNVLTHDTTFKLESLMTTNALIDDQLPILRYHSQWRMMWGLNPEREYTAFRGFDPRTDLAPYSGEEYMFPTEEKVQFNQITQIYIDKIVALCKEKDVKLLFVSSPSAISMNYQKHNAIQAYADEHDIPYLDFNLMRDEIGLDWSTDTMDGGDHINYNGTVKITNYMMKYLKENYDLKDWREE